MDLKKISDFEWEIPVEDGMNVPGRVFASEKLIKDMKRDKTFEQVRNVARLPGIVGASFAMADAHQGYGFPIGGVAAFDIEKGVVCPGCVGFDINCGVRVLATDIDVEDFMGKRKEVLHSVFRSVPSGVGGGRSDRLSRKELDEVLREGAEWAVRKGFGVAEDLERCEEGGKISGCRDSGCRGVGKQRGGGEEIIFNVDPSDVSDRAKGRGLGQLGTLGAGNHFLEFQRVDEIYDEKVAKVFGIEKGKVVVMIHCGSRGFGHQVASDYIKKMSEVVSPESLAVSRDGELVSAPIKSDLGKRYLSAMNCAVNFAFCNRQLIMHYVREQLKYYFPNSEVKLVYDVCHNIAKVEEHFCDVVKVGGGKGRFGEDSDSCRRLEEMEVLVMRKGATRAFGPGRVEVPEVYRKVGQPVILPGSMGTSSYILVGTARAMEISFGSTAHGAGRVMSRHEAWKKFSEKGVVEEMRGKDIEFEAGSRKGIVEEAPGAYKDVDEVVRVSHELGIGKMVARLKPLAVMKG